MLIVLLALALGVLGGNIRHTKPDLGGTILMAAITLAIIGAVKYSKIYGKAT